MVTEMFEIWCGTKTEHSTCRRPVQFVFHGSEGPFYRWRKCMNKVLVGRDDIVVLKHGD